MSLATTLRDRRQALARQFPHPLLLWSGGPRSRNFAANVYPFRASSHWLYWVGRSQPYAAVYLEAGRLSLFIDPPQPADALWHGPQATPTEIATAIEADAVYPLNELARQIAAPADIATVPAFDLWTLTQQQTILGRTLNHISQATARDRQLAQAIAQVRLIHDEAAIAAIRAAVDVTLQAHQAGMMVTPQAPTAAAIRATMEGVILGHNCTCAYNSIVTPQGEVLHHEMYHHAVQAGDLLLADVGAETATGWAADVTRTWPTSGQFSPSQRALYELVLAAHDTCIAAAKPGVEYRDLHLLASRVLAEGLVELGILRGDRDGLVEQDAHALFFPHGIGHLLGLDVHDMEDLGDIAGYAEGRHRSDRFGLGFLRLDRPLQAGMVVTIEPGFYQVPAILGDPDRRDRYADSVNWSRLADFADVRGIRIEDDVLITPEGAEVLTQALPTAATEIEAIVQAGQL